MTTSISKDRAIKRPSRWREEMARALRNSRKPRPAYTQYNRAPAPGPRGPRRKSKRR